MSRPVDARGLAAFRILLGATMSVGAIRFLWNGWVERFFVEPTFFFPYWGFEWVQPLSSTAMHGAFVAMAVLGAMVSVGFLYRFAIVAFGLLFTYVELIDVTNYLNHYYFLTLLCVVMALVPAHRKWSIDALLRPRLRSDTVGAWTYGLLRFQVAVVWLSAALAKVTTDWLVHAQPLNIWLSSRADLPVLGDLFAHWEVALLASWAGFLYDASIPFLLLWKRTRAFAFVAVLAFHLSTAVLFNIGMFPLIMLVSATIFFGGESPSDGERMSSGEMERGTRWASPKPTRGFSPGPRSFPFRDLSGKIRGSKDAILGGVWGKAPRCSGETPSSSSPDSTPAIGERASSPDSKPALALRAFIVCWCVLQVAMPLRFLAYEGNILWNEQGMRWAFKVLCREKNGTVTFRVEDTDGRVRHVQPSRYLTRHQEREMSVQPDMILRLAHHIGDNTGPDARVFADAFVSLNGRAPHRFVDPEVDLMTVSDGLSQADWILDAPTAPPPRLERTRP